ncbi:hypothetical protein Q604_UNBC00170G0001, partial [human gut metagenome]
PPWLKAQVVVAQDLIAVTVDIVGSSPSGRWPVRLLLIEGGAVSSGGQVTKFVNSLESNKTLK